MLWIVQVALRRPYTFAVMAILILSLGPLVYMNMRTDIFPDIKVPVVSVVWTYNGLPASEMSDRITTYYERQMTTAVNDIEHIESQSLSGVAIVKVFFHPGVDINGAVSQITAVSQTVLKRMPPGITPPLVLTYNASSVPILPLALSSKTRLDNQLFDISNNFNWPRCRVRLCPHPMEARIAKSWLILILRRCVRMVFLRWTLPMPWLRRI